MKFIEKLKVTGLIIGAITITIGGAVSLIMLAITMTS